MGLCTGAPGNNLAVDNEASGALYARQPIKSDNEAITFNVDSGTYTHIVICVGPHGDNLCEWTRLSSDVVMSSPGQICVTVNGLNAIPILTWEETWNAYVGANLEGDAELAATLLLELARGYHEVDDSTEVSSSSSTI